MCDIETLTTLCLPSLKFHCLKVSNYDKKNTLRNQIHSNFFLIRAFIPLLISKTGYEFTHGQALGPTLK